MQPEPKIGDIWRHVKTGGFYAITGFCILEATWRMAVLYIPVTKSAPHTFTDNVTPIARDLEEFKDGRFTYVEPMP